MLYSKEKAWPFSTLQITKDPYKRQVGASNKGPIKLRMLKGRKMDRKKIMYTMMAC